MEGNVREEERSKRRDEGKEDREEKRVEGKGGEEKSK